MLGASCLVGACCLVDCVGSAGLWVLPPSLTLAPPPPAHSHQQHPQHDGSHDSMTAVSLPPASHAEYMRKRPRCSHYD